MIFIQSEMVKSSKLIEDVEDPGEESPNNPCKVTSDDRKGAHKIPQRKSNGSKGHWSHHQGKKKL
jgi:hypothetical protein